MTGASLDRFRFPRLRAVLPNGLTVVAMRRSHLPTLSLTMLLPAGIRHEPADRPGTAHFASQLLTAGTRSSSATELAERVDHLGAGIAAGCDYDYGYAEAGGLSKDAPALFDLLAEIVLESSFLEEEIERRRALIPAHLERRKDDYSDVVRNRFLKEIYGTHPYHRTKEGTAESIRAISRDELLAFHAGAAVPRGAILAVLGEIDPAEAVAAARERFGSWDGKRGRDRAEADPPRWDARRVVTLEQEAAQAYIRVGDVGIRRTDPDYHAAIVMNYILGGAGFGSRLMRRLREQGGLTYGAYSNFVTRGEPGYFFAATQTRVETANEALAAMLEEIDRFAAEGPTEEEIAWAKRFLTGSLPLTLETNDQLAQRLIEQELYRLADSYWIEDLEKIDSLAREEVAAAAARLLHSERFAIVVLGKLEGGIRVEGGAGT